MTTCSSCSHPSCWVNGCQRTRRSSAASSAVVTDGKLMPASVGKGVVPLGRMRRPRLELVVFVVGAASLGAEIAAARLLAPYFGASTIVWANTIATVLVALSAGYWLGGRLADRNPTFEGLCLLVLGAAALLAAVPFAAGPFLRTSVDALDSISAGAFVGSLVGVLVLVAAPLLLLGAGGAHAPRLSVRGVEEAGTGGGGPYAVSPPGALLRVFLS